VLALLFLCALIAFFLIDEEDRFRLQLLPVALGAGGWVSGVGATFTGPAGGGEAGLGAGAGAGSELEEDEGGLEVPPVVEELELAKLESLPPGKI